MSNLFSVFLLLQAKKAQRKVIFRKAEGYVKEYRKTERNLIRMRRQAKNAGNFYVEPEAKLAFVVRIRGCVIALLPFVRLHLLALFLYLGRA